MLANLTSSLDFHSNALVLRAERQRVIASNIANADTPGYAGRDINFKEALTAANGAAPASSMPRQATGSGNPRHIPLQASTTSLDATALRYTTQSQPAMDGNSVDMDRERANFVDNSVRYEATLRFINGQSKTLLSAIQGQ